MAVMHGESPILGLKECHFYIPESETYSRVFILMFIKVHTLIAHLIKPNLLRLVEVHIKLNNEVGMDWVRRNFGSFPTVVEPNLSR